jgi:hemerythrin-like domain-containing protein
VKRHAALIPLSHDHHQGLVQALRLQRAAAGGDAIAQTAAASEFLKFFRNEHRVHLRDEEERLFPLLLRHTESEPASLHQARLQHVQLEGLVRKLEIATTADSVEPETLDATGTLLETHIRLEERELFPLIEQVVPDDELNNLGFADRVASCDRPD